MKKVPFLLLLILFLGACKNNNSSNNELFNKHYQKNVDKCTEGLLKADIDLLTATRKCECMLTTLYEIDSTFVKKSNREINTLIDENITLIDSLCNEL